MNYDEATGYLLKEDGVELSTMMKSPCLRYHGEFMAMFFDKADALIVKLSPERVNALIANGQGEEFNFTKKRFREWVLIPQSRADEFENRMREALEYAKLKTGKK